MANIEKRINRDGQPVYYFRAYTGRGIDGRQIRHSMKWVPPPDVKGHSADKQARIEAARFEERVNAGMMQDGSIRFVDFAEKWLEEYARPQLKAKTIEGYVKLLPRIYEAIGHMKLKDIRPGHLTRFYYDLQHGPRQDIRYQPAVDLNNTLKVLHLKKKDVTMKAGIGERTFRAICHGENAAADTAQRIADALGLPLAVLFKPVKSRRALSANTVRHYHALLSSVFAKAVKWGYIPTNPATNAEPPKLQHTEAAYLEEQDARRFMELLQAEPVKWRAPVMFDLLSGLRRGELLGLRWRDADFQAQTITVVQTSVALPGKGIITDTPKNKTSARPLKLSRSAFLILREYQAWQEERRQICGDYWKDTDGRIFTGDDGAPLHPDALTGWVTDFARRNGFEGIHLHSLRHSYASLMIADGTPLVVVSRRMGHSLVSTTANIYAHMIASADEKAAQVTEKFADIVAPLEDKPERKIRHFRRASK